jgi:hypothetical protein
MPAPLVGHANLYSDPGPGLVDCGLGSVEFEASAFDFPLSFGVSDLVLVTDACGVKPADRTGDLRDGSIQWPKQAAASADGSVEVETVVGRGSPWIASGGVDLLTSTGRLA